ncbi:SGNH/GDSL hydrolase family protein [Paenibacillus sediminis]|uniref:Lysophospholipase L1-like esterase n=1 Tax=Paenibacillus sediminis TaxID=664909 RepID=A0ABS4H116_9BACL|nr:SGNH/GDSL hydrolase family protein [Paenibacillus sediminis]MBP1936214.1 lysophospholipase L1-like esterase [Paenibacillus sediminis]
MKLHASDTLLFIGDSITDSGRARPVGEGGYGALGNGYVSHVDALLRAVYPQLGIRVLNTGVSGDTVRHLKARWQSDVLDLNPDWLSIMIGTNDVWRQFDRPLNTDQHIYLDEYERLLRELISVALPHLKGLVLMSPFYLEMNSDDPMRATMDVYRGVMKKVAYEVGAIFVDTQAAFDQFSEHVYLSSLSMGWDRVHPDQPGHMILAREFLRSIDFSWNGE